MNPDEATSLKQLFLSMLPKDGGIVVGTVTKESPLTIQIENDEKLEISGSALLVPRNLTDYQVKVDIALADGKIDSNTHVGGAHGHKFQLFDSRGGGVTGLVGCPLEGDKDKPVGDYQGREQQGECAHPLAENLFHRERSADRLQCAQDGRICLPSPLQRR